MYHRNKVHTDEFWKYEMAKHRRTVIDDKDRNDDMWQQQLGRYGSDISENAYSSKDHYSRGENQIQHNTDPTHDEKWMQQIKRAKTAPSDCMNKYEARSDGIKLVALESLQSSLRSIDSESKNRRDDGIKHTTRSPSHEESSYTETVPRHEESSYTEGAPRIKIKAESLLGRSTNSTSKSSESSIIQKSNLENDVKNKYPTQHQQPDDNYLTLLAHLSAQRKACEEQSTIKVLTHPTEGTIPTGRAEDQLIREKQAIHSYGQSQTSESTYSHKIKDRHTPPYITQEMNQDQRSSSKSPPTLSLPDMKEESSVTRTKMWLAQLGHYRQKAVQEEMEKSHDELWEEQIARAKHNQVKSPIEPLEVTIEDEINNIMGRSRTKNHLGPREKGLGSSKYNIDESSLSTDNSSSSISTPSILVAKEGKTAQLISALQLQRAPNRAFSVISNDKLPLNAEDISSHHPTPKLRLPSYSRSSSPKSFAAAPRLTPPPPPVSPIESNEERSSHVSFKNLLSIDKSTIVNVNGQAVRLQGARDGTECDDKNEKRESSKPFGGRISLSTTFESNNNNNPAPMHMSNDEEESNHEERHERHIPLAIPPLQPTSHSPPTAKPRQETVNHGQGQSKNVHIIKEISQYKDEMVKENKPKYPPPDPSKFGSSSVLKMLLLDPSKRKRPGSPPPASPVSIKRSDCFASNVQGNKSNFDKSSELPSMFNRFSGGPNTSDETDILRRRLLGLKDPPVIQSALSKSAQMVLPKPKYSAPSATITSADMLEKQSSSFHKKSPMAVEEFTKVAAAAATLASFNLTRVEDAELNKKNNLECSKTTKKVNLPIEVNYEQYYQENTKYALKSSKDKSLPTQENFEQSMIFEDDLKTHEREKQMLRNEFGHPQQQDDKRDFIKQAVQENRNMNNTKYNDIRSYGSEDEVSEQRIVKNENVTNLSAYSRTSVSKQLLHRYTTHNYNNNNNNNNNNETFSNHNRREIYESDPNNFTAHLPRNGKV